MKRPTMIRPRGLDLFPFAPAWMGKALCAKVGHPDDWHPESEYADQVDEVRLICQGCPVRTQCLEHVLSTRRVRTGIWAGTTTSQRRRLRRERRQQAA